MIMNREIKFRGLTIGGDWVYGNYSFVKKAIKSYKHIEGGHYISNSSGMPFAYAIRPETVGQYIGVKDKNKVDIYEGDILVGIQREQRDKESKHAFKVKGVVRYSMGCPKIFSKAFSEGCTNEDNIFHVFMWMEQGSLAGRDRYYQIESIEVIGNFHQHQELLS